MALYLAALKKYADFNGRAQRAEFWTFTLVNNVIFIALMSLGSSIHDPGNYLAIVFLFAIILPGLAVSFRRLHDTGRSAWWILISLIPFVGGIVLLVFNLLDSQPGQNKYGPNPKGIVGQPSMTSSPAQ